MKTVIVVLFPRLFEAAKNIWKTKKTCNKKTCNSRFNL